jgi:hypothetical protein
MSHHDAHLWPIGNIRAEHARDQPAGLLAPLWQNG